VSFREALRARAEGIGARLVFPEGDDPRVRDAAVTLRQLGFADPLLLRGGAGIPPDDPLLPRVAAHLREQRPQAVRDGVEALDFAGDPLRYAASLVALGEADGCLAGVAHPTADVIRAALWAIGVSEPGGSVSSAMYLGLPDGRVLTYTDIGVLPEPTAEQLAHAARDAVRDRARFVGDEPVVAFLSYSTRGSAEGDSVATMRAALARFRELAPGVRADGELQGDAALVPEVARRKCPDSEVQGAANVLVFPSLDAGNIAYKLTQRLAGASAAGPLLQGLARPMSDLSRGADPDDIVDVACLVALRAHARP
jgi:phosphate acetyltransferase